MGDKEAVLIQAERKLNETTAGKENEQKETIKQFQQKAKSLNDLELVKQLEAEQRHFEGELHNTLDDMDNLKISSYKHTTLLFSKRTQTLSLPEVAKRCFKVEFRLAKLHQSHHAMWPYSNSELKESSTNLLCQCLPVVGAMAMVAQKIPKHPLNGFLQYSGVIKIPIFVHVLPASSVGAKLTWIPASNYSQILILMWSMRGSLASK
ncbi:hypothetical protein EDC04DRAFT_2609458 [Pisolithus marmoratus]|nr:hypothetical protein EDC04DRAFT_2609458 [Pisolithus marmoratus]